MAPDVRNPDARQAAPRYAASGVDIDANERLIPRFKALAQNASRPEVVGGVGAFSGLFDLSGYRDPLLVASTDSVGTKVLIARMLDRYDTVGEDLVNHCVNDILTAGARPLFFLDYLGNNALTEDQKVEIVRGVARACGETGTALLGGETADLPDLYRAGDFDLAGSIVGVVQKGHAIDGAGIVPGDVLIGLPSSGLHTNGYSLVRRAFGLRVEDMARAAETLQAHDADLAESLGEALLRPHLSYWPRLEPVLAQCKGIAHITGGGIPGNLVRVLPPGSAADLRQDTWPALPLFTLIQRRGKISDAEMFHVFNMGIGLIVAVDRRDAAAVQAALEPAFLIGEIVSREAGPAVRILPPDA